jgi:hypothetical protein
VNFLISKREDELTSYLPDMVIKDNKLKINNIDLRLTLFTYLTKQAVFKHQIIGFISIISLKTALFLQDCPQVKF